VSRSSSTPSPLRLLALIALAAGIAGLAPYAPEKGAARPDRLKLPPIVFVSRQPVILEPFSVPGLGPHHRGVVTGGRLMLREPDGTVRELLPRWFRDVAHPSVAPDGRRVLFSAAMEVGINQIEPLVRWFPMVLDLESGTVDTLRGRWEWNGGSVLQPCWISDSLFCFALSEPTARSQYGHTPVTQIAVASATVRGEDEGRVSSWRRQRFVRVTSDRNGAETPTWDDRSGRIVYSRWWYNRWQAADDSSGVTIDPAHELPRDSVNLWQIVSIRPDGTDLRVEASGLGTRHESMGYQPVVLADGSIVATYASNLGLSPGPVTLGIQRFSPRLGHAKRLAGAIIEEGSDYASPRGLAAPAACAPAALPSGRILFSYAPGGRGDFGLYVMNKDGSRIEKVFDLPGSFELDAAPVVARRLRRAPPDPFATTADAANMTGTFRFHSLDVFGGGHARAGVRAAPPRTDGARIRFWKTEPRERDGVEADSAILIREVPIRPDGSVDEIIPADTPLFEQLIDAHGKVLRTADGPAHVAGYNWGRPGTEVRCVGCHVGHSLAPVPKR
jgi:hypothetical protein